MWICIIDLVLVVFIVSVFQHSTRTICVYECLVLCHTMYGVCEYACVDVHPILYSYSGESGYFSRIIIIILLK